MTFAVRVRPVPLRFAVDPAYKLLHVNADPRVPELKQGILDAWKATRDSIDVDKLAAFFTKHGPVDNIDWAKAHTLYAEAVTSVCSDIAQKVALKSIPRLQQQMQDWRKVHKVLPVQRFAGPTPDEQAWMNVSFTLRHKGAEQFLKNYLPTKITLESNETRDAIRQIELKGFEEGGHPYELAEQIKGLIGMNGPQLKAFDNFMNGWPTPTPAGMQMFTDTALQQRAELIARTETLRAANAGQTAMWQEAANNGLLVPNETSEVWIITPDDRLCPDCAELDGQTIDLGDSFDGGKFGTTDYPPLHPDCRCTTGLAFDDLPGENTATPPEAELPPEVEPIEPETIEQTPVEDLPAPTPPEPEPEPPVPPVYTDYLTTAGSPELRAFDRALREDMNPNSTDITSPELQAVREYAYAGYEETNAALRGTGPWTPAAQDVVGGLDSLLARSGGLPENVILRRGTDEVPLRKAFGVTDVELADVAKLRQRLVGQLFQDPAYLSTSYLEGFSHISPISWVIEADAGTRAFYVEPYAAIPGENEVLFPRGTILYITDVEINAAHWTGRQTVIHATTVKSPPPLP